MNKTDAENMPVLWSELEPIVYSALKDAPGFYRGSDGIYHYEVNPIPGDYLDKTVAQKVLAADCSEDVIIQAVGWKYFDAIDAAERALFQYCLKNVDFSAEEQRLVLLLLAQNVIIHVPVSHYKKTLNNSDRLL